MLRVTTALLLFASGTAFAQPGETAPRFEVASVKPANPAPGSASGIQTGQGRLNAQNVTLKRCIMGAYGVGPNQVLGGPVWLDLDRFEILARAGQPLNDDARFMLMLRDVLADRFKLALHRETRSLPAYLMEVARNGPKLEKAQGGPPVTNTSSGRGSVAIEARNTDMDGFANLLSRRVDRPVINQTGLAGPFDFKLHWNPDPGAPENPASAEDTPVFTAIQEQLGLRLRAAPAPIEVLVIDHAEKPSAN